MRKRDNSTMKKYMFICFAVIVFISSMLIGCDKSNEATTPNYTDKEQTFTVKFDANGGVQVAGDIISLIQTVVNAKELVEPKFEREGYLFNGWNVDLSSIKADTVVYAQWIEDNKLEIRLANEYFHASKNRTVHYTINGRAIYSIEEGTLIALLNIDTPSISEQDKEDFEFLYWGYKNGDGKYVKIDNVEASKEIAQNGVITLYPVSSWRWIGPL